MEISLTQLSDHSNIDFLEYIRMKSGLSEFDFNYYPAIWEKKFDPMEVIDQISFNADQYAKNLLWLCESYFNIEMINIIEKKLAEIFYKISNTKILKECLIFFPELRTSRKFKHYINKEKDIVEAVEIFGKCPQLQTPYWKNFFFNTELPNNSKLYLLGRIKDEEWKKKWRIKIFESGLEPSILSKLIVRDSNFQTTAWYEYLLSMQPKPKFIGIIIIQTNCFDNQKLYQDYKRLGGTDKLLEYLIVRIENDDYEIEYSLDSIKS